MNIDSDYNTLSGHLTELQDTVIKSLLAIILGVAIALFFYQEIFQLLKSPLNETKSSLKSYHLQYEQIINTSSKNTLYTLPPHSKLLILPANALQINETTFEIPPGATFTIEKATNSQNLFIFGPIDGMAAMLKVSFFVGLLLSSPVWLYFILRFIAPALDNAFYHLIIPFLLSSLSFMGLGIAFAFFITIPTANAYLQLFNQDLGINLWSLSNYLDYTVLLMIGNGLSFEMAVIAVFLVQYGFLSAKRLITARRYFIVAAFILAAFLTPPDVLTQVMLAIPLIILYEFIILYAKLLRRKNYLGART